MDFVVENKNYSVTKRFAILNDDGIEVGHGLLYILSDESHDKPYGYLSDVLIKEEFRAGGFGGKLVREIIRAAKEDFNCYKLLCTSRDSRGIVDWYKKLGFRAHSTGFRMDFDLDAAGGLK